MNSPPHTHTHFLINLKKSSTNLTCTVRDIAANWHNQTKYHSSWCSNRKHCHTPWEARRSLGVKPVAKETKTVSWGKQKSTYILRSTTHCVKCTSTVTGRLIIQCVCVCVCIYIYIHTHTQSKQICNYVDYTQTCTSYAYFKRKYICK